MYLSNKYLSGLHKNWSFNWYDNKIIYRWMKHGKYLHALSKAILLFLPSHTPLGHRPWTDSCQAFLSVPALAVLHVLLVSFISVSNLFSVCFQVWFQLKHFIVKLSAGFLNVCPIQHQEFSSPLDSVEFVKNRRHTINLYRHVYTWMCWAGCVIYDVKRQTDSVICVYNIQDVENILWCMFAYEPQHVVQSMMHIHLFACETQDVQSVMHIHFLYVKHNMWCMYKACSKGIWQWGLKKLSFSPVGRKF